MKIHYFMFEATPLTNNPEKEFCKGAFINCWVKSADEELALREAIDYVRREEGWVVTKIEDHCIVNRQQYEENSELEDCLKCFDRAESGRIGVIVYTWSNDDV